MEQTEKQRQETEVSDRVIADIIADDVNTLHSQGYAQELRRRMSGFANFALSMSVICILAGGITSFHLALSSVGGAAILWGWPASCAFSLLVAVAMAQLASAFPTAGGLYHWASRLGGKGWGWATAWFNLAGLILVIAAINVGTYQILVNSIGPELGWGPRARALAAGLPVQIAVVAAITVSQGLINHLGIRLTSLLTDLSGYLILAVATGLALAMLACARGLHLSNLLTWRNYSGPPGGGVWPVTASLSWLFVLGLLHPLYTVTGFDASANTAEETIGAARSVPRAIVRAVVWSGLFGWLMLLAIVLAIPDMDAAAGQGERAFPWIMSQTLPGPLRLVLYGGILLANYLCGLATLTSCSRMIYAFARDDGLPASAQLRLVSPRYYTPVVAIWVACALSVAFTVYTPVYSTLTAACSIMLYLSYVLPIALGFFAYGRTWTQMGPWHLGRGYRFVAGLCVMGCVLVFLIGVSPPNEKVLWISLGAVGLTTGVWFGYERGRFRGPPHGVMNPLPAEARPPGDSS